MQVVIYRRVSTDKQGITGLGMEAQQVAINSYLACSPQVEVLQEFSEVDSGTKKGLKPKLQEAIALCKAQNATLIIAKLDRMSRSVAQISTLMESKVNFIALDNVHANPFTIHVLAACAEYEAKQISDRTKAALNALKLQGKKLGTPANLTPAAKMKGLSVVIAHRKEKAIGFANTLLPTILQLQLKNFSLNKISEHLNLTKVPTSTGKVGVWQANKVRSVLNCLNT